MLVHTITYLPYSYSLPRHTHSHKVRKQCKQKHPHLLNSACLANAIVSISPKHLIHLSKAPTGVLEKENNHPKQFWHCQRTEINIL